MIGRILQFACHFAFCIRADLYLRDSLPFAEIIGQAIRRRRKLQGERDRILSRPFLQRTEVQRALLYQRSGRDDRGFSRLMQSEVREDYQEGEEKEVDWQENQGHVVSRADRAIQRQFDLHPRQPEKE